MTREESSSAQRSLKIADVCMSSSMHVQLFVEILNQYLYYLRTTTGHIENTSRA